MDGISEIVICLYISAVILAQISQFSCPLTQKHITRGHSISYSANRAFSPIVVLCVFRKEAFILSSTANTYKLKLRLFLDFFSYEYFIFRPLLNRFRLNHSKLKFHVRFCVGVSRTRLGCALRQDAKNVRKCWGRSNVVINTKIIGTVTIYRSALLPLLPASPSPLLILPSSPASFSSPFSFHGLCLTSCSEWHTCNNRLWTPIELKLIYFPASALY